MQDIGDAAEWAAARVGGEEAQAPPKGWLVVAIFHTLWSKQSIKVMPLVAEVVPMFQDAASFVSVRADCQGMTLISKAMKASFL